MNLKPKLLIALAAVLVCSALAFGQDVAGVMGAGGGGPMAVAGKKMYVVTGSTLAVINLTTNKVESKIDLSQIAKEIAEEQNKKTKESYMKRFDKNGDGTITEDEGKVVKYWDKNKDGKVTLEEIPVGNRPSPAAYGNADILVHGTELFMLRNGMLFAFNAKTLELTGSVTVEEKKDENSGYGRRGGGNRGPQKRKPGGQQGGAPNKTTTPGKKTEKNEGGQVIF